MAVLCRGWKRTVGGVTLVMACLFMGAWIRGGNFQYSFISGDAQGVITNGTMLARLSASARDGFVWSRTQIESNLSWLAGWKVQPVASGYLFDPEESCNEISMSVTDCRWRFCGFEIGRYHGCSKYGELETFLLWRLSHESIVIPLASSSPSPTIRPRTKT